VRPGNWDLHRERTSIHEVFTDSWMSRIIPAEGVKIACSKPKSARVGWLTIVCNFLPRPTASRSHNQARSRGMCLYLALEDSKRRLQSRMAKLVPLGVTGPEALT